jgi:hypothetical protein
MNRPSERKTPGRQDAKIGFRIRILRVGSGFSNNLHIGVLAFSYPTAFAPRPLAKNRGAPHHEAP